VGASATSVYTGVMSAIEMNCRAKTHSIDFNNAHVVSIDPEKEHCKCTSVDNSQTVGFPRNKIQSSVLVEARQVSSVRGKVNQRRLCRSTSVQKVAKAKIMNLPGTGSAPPGFHRDRNFALLTECWS
jgi:hypothetical protein